jgi:hypothetical protein
MVQSLHDHRDVNAPELSFTVDIMTLSSEGESLNSWKKGKTVKRTIAIIPITTHKGFILW